MSKPCRCRTKCSRRRPDTSSVRRSRADRQVRRDQESGMRLGYVATGAIALALAAAAVLLRAQDADRVITGGGVHVQGWTGKVDASSARQGRSVNDAKLVQEGGDLH